MLGIPYSDRSSPGSDETTLAGAVGGTNESADEGLLSRFASSGKPTIGALLEGHDVSIPKQGPKEVCLSWALKGRCGRSCKRAAMHVPYTPGTVAKLHRLLTSCGVSNPQE